MGRKIGFTADTEVWCSAGCYKQFNDLWKNGEFFMTNSFCVEERAFVVGRALAVRSAENCELVEVTFGPTKDLGECNKNITVRCAPNQRFLTCYENNGTMHYKGNETFFWVEAKDLKVGRRLVAEDINIEVKSVRLIEEHADVYSIGINEQENFSIRIGAIVEC